ncbi:MAG: glycosyltransferase family 2 protein [bacterium]
MMIAAVIPVYGTAERHDEREQLPHVVSGIIDYVDQVLLVDDGSDQETVKAMEAIVGEHPTVSLVHHILNRGQGAALATGNAWAIENNADIIVHFDADGQHQSGDIPVLVEPLLKGTADIVFGSRFINKTHASNLPLSKRWLILPIGRIVNWLLTGCWMTDAHCGLRAMARQAAERIVIIQDGFAHNTEILEEIGRLNLRVEEVPVVIHYNRYGQGFSHGLKIASDLLWRRLR